MAITQVIAIITERFSPSIQVRGVFLDLLLVLCQFGIVRPHVTNAVAEVGHRLRLAVFAQAQEDHREAEAYARVGNDPTEGIGRRQVNRRAVIADESLHDLLVAHAYRLHLRDAFLAGLGEAALQHAARGQRILAAALALQARAHTAHVHTGLLAGRLGQRHDLSLIHISEPTR